MPVTDSGVSYLKIGRCHISGADARIYAWLKSWAMGSLNSGCKPALLGRHELAIHKRCGKLAPVGNKSKISSIKVTCANSCIKDSKY